MLNKYNYKASPFHFNSGKMKFSSKSLIFYVRFKHADIRSRIKAMPSDIRHRA